jgi:hypothetical protein
MIRHEDFVVFKCCLFPVHLNVSGAFDDVEKQGIHFLISDCVNVLRETMPFCALNAQNDVMRLLYFVTHGVLFFYVWFLVFLIPHLVTLSGKGSV